MSVSPEKAVPDVVTPLIGYRCWQVREQDGGPALYAPFRHTAWKRYEHATCNNHYATKEFGTHTAPHPQCKCGIYAYHTLQGAERNLHFSGTGTHIAGIIEMWGACEVHPTGTRAEHARIVALIHMSRAHLAVLAAPVLFAILCFLGTVIGAFVALGWLGIGMVFGGYVTWKALMAIIMRYHGDPHDRVAFRPTRRNRIMAFLASWDIYIIYQVMMLRSWIRIRKVVPRLATTYQVPTVSFRQAKRYGPGGLTAGKSLR